jgi:hypothetical protein
MKTAQLLKSIAVATLLAGSVQLIAAQTAQSPCPLGHEPGHGRSLSATERAEHRGQVQQMLGQLGAKRDAGTITAGELAWLERLEQRGGMGINGVPRGPGAGRGPARGGGQGYRQGLRDGTGPRSGQGTCQLGEISPTTAASLVYLKEEEKLARDVYRVLFERWGHATFGKIADAEQRHMDAVTRLITRYALEDAAPVESGVFANAALQAFYNESVTAGVESLAKALGVGIIIEEADIASLEAMLKEAVDLPVQRVLTNLLQASRNHLRAFHTALGAIENAPANRGPNRPQGTPARRGR